MKLIKCELGRFYYPIHAVAAFALAVITTIFFVAGEKSPQALLLLSLSWGCLFTSMYLKVIPRFGIPRAHAIMYLLIIAGSLLQIWAIVTYNPVHHIFSDPARHWDQGKDLLRIDVMSVTDPIMYQLYIAFLAKVTLQTPQLVAFMTSVLALVTPWVWYKFFRELQSNKLIALAGWAFLSLLPSWMSIYSYFMQETLMLPLLGASLWATWRARRKNELYSFSLMVFLWIITGLTRGIAIPLAAVCCTWLWIEQDNKLRKSLASLFLLAMILGPLTYRSYYAVGLFAPHGVGYMNMIYALSGKQEIHIHTQRQGASWLHGFGSPSMGSQPFAPFSDWTSQRTGRVTIHIDLSKGSEDWERELDKIQVSLRDYAWMTKENLIFLFFGQSWPDNNPARLLDRVNIVSRFMWFPMLVITLIWIFLRRRQLKDQWMLPSLLLAWFVIQGLVPIVPSEGRYRKPFEGLLAAQLILLAGVSMGRARPGANPAGGGLPFPEWLQYYHRRRKSETHELPTNLHD